VFSKKSKLFNKPKKIREIRGNIKVYEKGQWGRYTDKYQFIWYLQ